ncbi:hypothetical protein K8I61_08575 [bacterium]|nr:hypothetical protein [bacterium]
MKHANRQVVAAMASGTFMVAAVTGVVSSVPAATVLWRAGAVAAATGFFAGFIAVVFERIWSK